MSFTCTAEIFILYLSCRLWERSDSWHACAMEHSLADPRLLCWARPVCKQGEPLAGDREPGFQMGFQHSLSAKNILLCSWKWNITVNNMVCAACCFPPGSFGTCSAVDAYKTSPQQNSGYWVSNKPPQEATLLICCHNSVLKDVIHDSVGRRLLDVCSWFPLEFAPCAFLSLSWFCFESFHCNE